MERRKWFPQSRRASFIEALVNTLLGYFISVLANFFLLPLFGLHPSITQSFGIGLVFTLIALARSYAIRRLFSRIHCRQVSE